MRFPSASLLLDRAMAVLRRFPWTLAAGALASVAAITAHRIHDPGGAGQQDWMRVALVAALAIPGTLAVSLTASARRWSSLVQAGTYGILALALVAFFVRWPGPDGPSYETIRYLQLSAILHLLVAFLPFLGIPESVGFWQCNRRLLEGFLGAGLYSGVLFGGTAMALAALDHLFGIKIKTELYVDVFFAFAFVVNTWIFLASVPEDLRALADDHSYPRSLMVFAQYILTPLAFTYLVLLLAYLVKIVLGGEWPHGWIGWLVASMSVTGLLGFLLVHPLRLDPSEGWIRTYSRWLFVGLVPAAVMLLVAFWKRIEPYGLTEPRVLGLLLGIWLLAIALLFAIRNGSSIRLIPITLTVLLLATLYGPVSLTRLSISSQARRLARMLAPDGGGAADAAEASAALRFLIGHGASGEIATAIGQELPSIDWKRAPHMQDSVGRQILAVAGVRYAPQRQRGDWFSLDAKGAVDVAGMEWAMPASSHDTVTRIAGPASIKLLPNEPSQRDQGHAIARFIVGADTLLFDLRPLARRHGMSSRDEGTAEALAVEARAGTSDGILVINYLNGRFESDSLVISNWSGTLFLRGAS